MHKLLLLADFPDHVLWDRSENGRPVTPESLSLSEETCRLLWEWYKMWSQIWLVDGYGSNNPDRQIDWALYDKQGIEIWKRVRLELAGRYEVFFYSHILEEEFEDPEKLEVLLRIVPLT